MDITEWAQVAAAVFAAIGLCFTGYQIRRAIRQRRIARVDAVRRELFGDEKLTTIYYQIEYARFNYTTDFHGSEQEKYLDKLLSIFDSLAKQVQQRLLSIKDLDLIAYEYIVVYQDSAVNKYFEFLDIWFEKRGITRQPFKAFREIGRVLEKHGYGHK